MLKRQSYVPEYNLRKRRRFGIDEDSLDILPEFTAEECDIVLESLFGGVNAFHLLSILSYENELSLKIKTFFEESNSIENIEDVVFKMQKELNSFVPEHIITPEVEPAPTLLNIIGTRKSCPQTANVLENPIILDSTISYHEELKFLPHDSREYPLLRCYIKMKFPNFPQIDNLLYKIGINDLVSVNYILSAINFEGVDKLKLLLSEPIKYETFLKKQHQMDKFTYDCSYFDIISVINNYSQFREGLSIKELNICPFRLERLLKAYPYYNNKVITVDHNGKLSINTIPMKKFDSNALSSIRSNFRRVCISRHQSYNNFCMLINNQDVSNDIGNYQYFYYGNEGIESAVKAAVVLENITNVSHNSMELYQNLRLVSQSTQTSGCNVNVKGRLRPIDYCRFKNCNPQKYKIDNESNVVKTNNTKQIDFKDIQQAINSDFVLNKDIYVKYMNAKVTRK